MNLKKEIFEGKIFVYPTDTVYGLGCNALDEKAVNKIREIKKRDSKPFSVIAPSLEWIRKNLVVDVELEKYFPGPFTLILKKKNASFLSHASPIDTLGVRIPDNEFTKKIQKTGFPFITTSVNLSGKPPANKIEEIPDEIIFQADFVINSGSLSGKPSTLIIEGKEIPR